MCKEIRTAVHADYLAVRHLWDLCFSDESGFNDWFFQSIWRPQYTLLLFDKQSLTAMMQMLPYQINLKGVIKEASYVYGACTSPEYRRRGLMSDLLNYSFQLDQQLGRAASILIPQEEWLFGFYQQFGYCPDFHLQEFQWDGRRMEPSKEYIFQRCTTKDIPELNRIYSEQCKANFVLRTPEQWLEQLTLFQQLGLGCWGIYHQSGLCAYAFLWEKGRDGIWLQETGGTQQTIFYLMTELSKRFSTSDIKVTTVPNWSKIETIPFGCIKYYNSPSFELKYYMNLMFN